MLKQLLTPEEFAVAEECIRSAAARMGEVAGIVRGAAEREAAGPEVFEQVRVLDQVTGLMRAVMGGEVEMSGQIADGAATVRAGALEMSLKTEGDGQPEEWPTELHAGRED